MALKLTQKPQWHEYQPGVRFLLAPLPRSVYRAIVREVGNDDDQLERLLADHIIRDWEGLLGDNDMPLPVTIDNKMAVRDHFLLAPWLDQRSNMLIEAEEAAEKN